ncbi:odorant receptor 4-like [Tenebrio molitor]|uniref:odorant receptor 4-like n=1 Tax=Tenebrio molitor TaxID=7067 RepID=UPI0036247931
MYVMCILSQLAEMISVFGDIEKMTNASFLTLTNVVQAFKLYPFIMHGARVRALINSINRSEFKPKNWEQRCILTADIKMSQLISKTWLFTCCLVCSLWGIFPLLDKGADDQIRLPLSGWFPFKTDESPMFEIVYAYQTVTSFVNGLGVVCMDTFMMGSIMVISGQLSVLNNAFENIKQSDEETAARRNLIQNIVHYRNIIQFADEMTCLFTTCIMSQFVVSVIISCMTLLQLTLVSVMSLQFVSMFLYEGCILLEIFLWCYYGNEVIVKSEQLTTSAFKSDWPDCNKEYKKDLLLFMIRSQRPLKLYAGGYFPLSLQTFMAIVKSSWSYFAVLNSVRSD